MPDIWMQAPAPCVLASDSFSLRAKATRRRSLAAPAAFINALGRGLRRIDPCAKLVTIRPRGGMAFDIGPTPSQAKTTGKWVDASFVRAVRRGACAPPAARVDERLRRRWISAGRSPRGSVSLAVFVGFWSAGVRMAGFDPHFGLTCAR